VGAVKAIGVGALPEKPAVLVYATAMAPGGVAVGTGAGAGAGDEVPPPHPLTANAAIAMPTNPNLFIELLLQNERGGTPKAPP
jgi:hypothetical protein